MPTEKVKNKKEPTKRGKNGGYRPGSGRKPKIADPTARELFNKAVDERWPLIMARLDEMIEKGDSATVLKIIEQRIGKAPQTLAVEGNQDKPLVIRWQT